MSFLEQKTKYDLSPEKKRPMSADTFAAWNQRGMYRTSYNDMYHKVSGHNTF